MTTAATTTDARRDTLLHSGRTRRAVPVIGAPVRSFDGKRVGTVGAVARGCFMLHRRFGRDCWLSDVLVREWRGPELVLHATRRDLRRYRRHGPGEFAPPGSLAPRFEFRESRSPRGQSHLAVGTVLGAALIASGVVAAVTAVAL